MVAEKDMIEINLSTPKDESNFLSDIKSENDGFPYGYSSTSQQTYFCSKSHSTGQLAEKAKLKSPAPNNISCLRQMYCPACHQRLHEDDVRLERLLKICCFTIFPIYPCCVKRPQSCKVICTKCGYYLGYWKQQ